MAAITKAEVKSYILLKDTLVENEAVTLPATTAGRRLANKYVDTIHRVTTGINTSDVNYNSTDNFYTTVDFAGYTLLSNLSTGAFSTGAAVKVSYDYQAYNDDIDTLIPQITEDVCDYLNNYFQDRIVYVDKIGGLAFVKGSPDTITDDNEDFSTAGFTTGMDVAVEGGSNYGIHTLAGVAAGTLTLNSTNAILSQDQDASYNSVGSIKISRINWPANLKPYLSQLIWYRLNRSRPDNILSEKLDDYSVTYINGNAYPTEVLNGLRKFRKAVLV